MKVRYHKKRIKRPQVSFQEARLDYAGVVHGAIERIKARVNRFGQLLNQVTARKLVEQRTHG